MQRLAPRAAAPLVAALLACAVAAVAAAPLLARPPQDCLAPAVSRLNEFSFYPEAFRSVIAERPPPAAGATVRAPFGAGMRSTLAGASRASLPRSHILSPKRPH